MTGWKGWERVRIDPGSGKIISGGAQGGLEAVAPFIISASRSTDIPAFYGDWFMDRLSRGYVTWVNPFNGTTQNVSFAKTRLLVFWSKNPEPFLPSLRELSREGWQMLVLFTLNEYSCEKLEPGIPQIEERIRTFSTVSSIVGKERLTWRFDPIFLSDTLTVDRILERISDVGDRVYRKASRLAFSFIDIERYPRVRHNLTGAGAQGVREPSTEEQMALAQGISDLNEAWGLEILACGEEQDFNLLGIKNGGCISQEILKREFSTDSILMDFLSAGPAGGRLKDPGQRKTCGCIPAKDIGRYGTCMHLCRYCYANASQAQVERNYAEFRRLQMSGIYHPSIIG